MRSRLIHFALVVLWLCAAGCQPPEKATHPDGYPYRVAATVGMVGDIVRHVAGDKAVVIGLLGAGVDPHLYKPTRDDVAELIRADIVFFNGLMLEGKMTDVLDKVGRHKPVVAVTARLPQDYLLFPDGAAGHADPHVWMDVSAWIQATRAVADALTVYDPPNQDVYQSNARQYIEQLEALDAYGKRVLESIPPESRILISSHDAFSYFGRAYEVEVMGVQGLSTESEAGLRRINDLVERISQSGVKAVFVESSVPRKSIEALVAGVRARGGTLSIGGELFTDAMGEEGTYEGTYIGMMDHNLTTVARALGGEAPPDGMQGKLKQAQR